MLDGRPVIEVENVARYYGSPRQPIRAVDGVSLTIRPGETLALVGESGCGKSTLSRVILRLEPPTRGRVRLDGEDITELTGAALRSRRRLAQMVFQDPYASLDPRMTIEAIVREPLDNYRVGSPAERRSRVLSLLRRVGLRADHAARFPHELSGGQRQRIGIARALALQPKIIVADEPVSALDVSVRAQVINLLTDIQKEFGLAMLFVSHDIGVVAHLSHRTCVMYLGQVVETGPTGRVVGAPQHPYSRALLDAIPVPHPGMRRPRSLLEGSPPSPSNPPTGCRFHPRCPFAQAQCRTEAPALRPLDADRSVACHLVPLPGPACSSRDTAR
jgi:peptide/nickel transport system ATP-binding protein/oligopeptide transport system ATP-binding protein